MKNLTIKALLISFAAGSLAGGVALDVLGLPGPVAGGIGGATACVLLLQLRGYRKRS
jgi:hypothetical protein